MGDEYKNYLNRTEVIDVDGALEMINKNDYLKYKAILVKAVLFSIFGAGFSMLMVIWSNAYDSNELLLKLFFTFLTIAATSLVSISVLDRVTKKNKED